MKLQLTLVCSACSLLRVMTVMLATVDWPEGTIHGTRIRGTLHKIVWYIWAVVVLLGVAVQGWILYSDKRSAEGGATGNKGWMIGSLGWLLPGIIFPLVAKGVEYMDVRITSDNRLVVEFGPWGTVQALSCCFTSKVDLRQVRALSVETRSMIWGYGVRLIPGDGTLFRISGTHCLCLAMDNGGRIMVGLESEADCTQLRDMLLPRVGHAGALA